MENQKEHENEKEKNLDQIQDTQQQQQQNEKENQTSNNQHDEKHTTLIQMSTNTNNNDKDEKASTTELTQLPTSQENTYTMLETQIALSKNDNINRRIWVLSESNKWRECTIIKEKGDLIRIHYIGYHPKYEEWIDKNHARIANNRSSELEVNDNLSVYSVDIKAWVEGEVAEIDKSANKVKILFVGTNKTEWLLTNCDRISIYHKNASAPYGSEFNMQKSIMEKIEEDEDSRSYDSQDNGNGNGDSNENNQQNASNCVML